MRLSILLLLNIVSWIGLPNIAFAEFFHQNAMSVYLAAHPMPFKGETSVLKSNMLDLSLEWIALPGWQATGGAVEVRDGIVFVLHPQGQLSWFNLDRRQGPFSTSIAAPMNLAALMASKKVKDEKVNTELFRAADLYIEPIGGNLRIYVTHHVFEDDCFFFQLSTVDIGFDAVAGFKQLTDWKILFKPSPCIHIWDASTKPFAGLQAGGKIVALDSAYLLVSYGDHELDGERGNNHPQDRNSPYGKMWKLAKDGSSASLYAVGVRNPQGLFLDRKGFIWESEHGPQGGDELNAIIPYANYGWPWQTYGVYYNNFEWRLNKVQGDHSDPRYKAPVFSWVPSIAPTSITQAEGPKFALWQDDLLLTTLKDQAIHHLRMDHGHVAYDERIAVGRRIRDVTAAGDGRLLLLADEPMIGIVDALPYKLIHLDIGKNDGQPAPMTEPDGQGQVANIPNAPAMPGEMLFNQSCGSCHALGENGIGPTLGNLTSRGIGKAPGFTYKSVALAEATGNWTPESFSSYVQNPAATFPDAGMAPINITGAEAKQIFEYLSKTGDAGPPAPDPFTDAQPPAQPLFDWIADSLAPFTLPFALDEKRQIAPYEELVPGLLIGYDVAAKSVVQIIQSLKPTPAISPENHQYIFSVDVEDPGTGEWISVEKTVPPFQSVAKYRVVMVMTAKLDQPAPVEIKIRIPLKSGKDYDIALGKPEVGGDFKSYLLNEVIDLALIADLDRAKSPKVLIVLPVHSGASATFAALDINLYPE